MDTEEHERLKAMKDHDLLVEIAVKTRALEEHSREQNGFIKDLMERALKLEGALGFGKWVMGIAIAGGAVGVTISIYIANGGG